MRICAGQVINASEGDGCEPYDERAVRELIRVLSHYAAIKLYTVLGWMQDTWSFGIFLLEMYVGSNATYMA